MAEDLEAGGIESDFHFDRDEFISELTSYYEFLVSMYLPESKLKRPPEGGWPSLTPDKLAFMEKTEDVMYIIQHMPYIREGDSDRKIAIYPGCIPVDYTGSSFARELEHVKQGKEPDGWVWRDIPPDEDMVFPPDVLWIGMWDCRDGDFMILDTRRGTITVMNLMSGAGWNELSEDGDDNQKWRDYPTWRFKDFFTMAKDQFTTLEYIPDIKYPDKVEISFGSHYYSVQKVYQKYGWPTKSYDKEGCVTELLRLYADEWEQFR